jgi:hypothetical protein
MIGSVSSFSIDEGPDDGRASFIKDDDDEGSDDGLLFVRAMVWYQVLVLMKVLMTAACFIEDSDDKGSDDGLAVQFRVSAMMKVLMTSASLIKDGDDKGSHDGLFVWALARVVVR